MLTDLFHTIIFELRMPLSMIAGAVHLLLDKEQEHFPPLDEKQAEVAEIAINNANRANEVIDELIKRAAKAKTLENLGSGLVQDYRRQLLEANQQLDKVNVKYQATQEVLQGLRHDLLEAVHRIMGFSRLFLEKPELMGGPLNREQLEGIELIRQSAENNYEIIKHYFFDLLKAIEVVDNEPEPKAVTLAEIGEMSQFSIASDLALDTAVSINKHEAETIINLLAIGWYKRNKGSVLEVTAEPGKYLRFRFPHTTEIPSSHAKNSVDGETGRLKFTERQRYFDPVGLATALVKKYGGAVYAELIGESIYHLSVTLPVYGEES